MDGNENTIIYKRIAIKKTAVKPGVSEPSAQNLKWTWWILCELGCISNSASLSKAFTNLENPEDIMQNRLFGRYEVCLFFFNSNNYNGKTIYTQ